MTMQICVEQFTIHCLGLFLEPET